MATPRTPTAWIELRDRLKRGLYDINAPFPWNVGPLDRRFADFGKPGTDYTSMVKFVVARKDRIVSPDMAQMLADIERAYPPRRVVTITPHRITRHVTDIAKFDPELTTMITETARAKMAEMIDRVLYSSN